MRFITTTALITATLAMPFAALAQLSAPPQIVMQPQQDAPANAPAQQQATTPQPATSNMPVGDVQHTSAPATNYNIVPEPSAASMAAPTSGNVAPSSVVAQPMQLRISHGITYISGGTTEVEIEQFRLMDAEFNLQMLLAAKTKDHLIAHRVRVLDYKGFELVSTQGVGPYLYAYIRPGTYKLEIMLEANSKPITVDLKVPNKGRVRKTILLK
jgi:hypothetical protein